MRTRFVAYYSNLDMLVPGRRAMITESVLRPRNILIKDEGHLSIMLSRRLADSIAERAAGDRALAPVDGWGKSGLKSTSNSQEVPLSLHKRAVLGCELVRKGAAALTSGTVDRRVPVVGWSTP